MLPAAELGELGFAIVLYANAALRCAQRAVAAALRRARATGSSAGLIDVMATWEERQAAVGKPLSTRSEARNRDVSHERGSTCGSPAAGRPPGRSAAARGGRPRRDGADRRRRRARRRRAARPRRSTCAGARAPRGRSTRTCTSARTSPLPQHARGRARRRPQAAAAGGVTTLRRLPDVAPSRTTRSSPIARTLMEADALIDFGFHFCIVTREQLEALPRYVAELGVSSFKFFMNFRGDEGELSRAAGQRRRLPVRAHARRPRTNGAMVDPHAENVELVWSCARSAACRGATRRWSLVTRCAPDYVEAEALQRVGLPRRAAGASVYAVHVTNARTLGRLCAGRGALPGDLRRDLPALPDARHRHRRAASRQGQPAAAYRRPTARRSGRRSPTGTIDMIGSDHVPAAPVVQGARTSGKASAGFPGLQNAAAAADLRGPPRRGIPLERDRRRGHPTRPARTFGLVPAQGRDRGRGGRGLRGRRSERPAHDRRASRSAAPRATRSGRAGSTRGAR